jgi:hypothetical protein
LVYFQVLIKNRQYSHRLGFQRILKSEIKVIFLGFVGKYVDKSIDLSVLHGKGGFRDSCPPSGGLVKIIKRSLVS